MRQQCALNRFIQVDAELRFCVFWGSACMCFEYSKTTAFQPIMLEKLRNLCNVTYLLHIFLEFSGFSFQLSAFSCQPSVASFFYTFILEAISILFLEIKNRDFGSGWGVKTEHSRSYVTLFTTIDGGKRSFFSPKYNFEIASKAHSFPLFILKKKRQVD